MRGAALFYPPERQIVRREDSPTHHLTDPLTWTKYDGSVVTKGCFECFSQLPIEIQLLIWKTSAEGWIADQEGECRLDNVVYSHPLRIRMKLPGLPPSVHVCSLSRSITYDVLRELCRFGNAKKVVDMKRLERFEKEYRGTNIIAGRESAVHLSKVDARGGKSTVTVRTHTWMVLKDFRVEDDIWRKRRTRRESADEEKDREVFEVGF